MSERKQQQDASLLDVLIDGFEKNDVLDGFHWRDLPMPDENAAAIKFATLMEEARRWKGEPARRVEEPTRRLVVWHDIEIRQAGRGVMVRVRAPRFHDWWHDRSTWQGDPMGPVYEWIAGERDRP